MPAATKQHVATIERGDRREIPQMPCPLVQPAPYRVPMPTTNPASAMTGSEMSNVMGGSVRTSA